jgi:integrase
MPHKTSRIPYYKVKITLPGYGETPRLSTKTERKELARKMEDALRYVWQDGHYALIEALEPEGPGRGGKIDLPTLYHAWRNGELGKLKRTVEDPPLKEAVRQYAKGLGYDNHRRGARHILRLTVEPSGPQLAGADARLSWLYEPKQIDRLLSHMIEEDGYAVNTVRNEPYGFLSKFLRHRLGEAEAQQILQEVERPSEDDRRDVWLTAGDVHRVVSASEWEVRMFLMVTASTGIDKSPALRIRKRDVDFGRWSLYVRDTKTKERKRTIQLPPVATLALKVLLEGKDAGEKAFSLTKGQLDYRWRKAREHAGLTPEEGYEDGVRLKDLRHTFAVHYTRSGGSVAQLKGRLGHSREAQSVMYASHELEGASDMKQAAQSMGLALPDWLKEELPEQDTSEEAKRRVPAWWYDPEAPPRIDGKTLPVPERADGRGGGRKGFSPSDYRDAVGEAGTVAGAARALGVDESTVRGMCQRHEIEVESVGGVPGR